MSSPQPQIEPNQIAPNTGLMRVPLQVEVVKDGVVLMERLFQTSPVRIGRMNDNEVILPFDFVSRFHCEIRYDGQAWKAVDLGSKAGIKITGQGGDKVRQTEVSFARNLDGKYEFYIENLLFRVTVKAAVDLGAQSFVAARRAERVLEVPLSSNSGSQPPAPDGASGRKRRSRQKDQQMLAVIPSRQPVLNVDLGKLLSNPHPLIEEGRENILMMLIVWHDQVLRAYEYLEGDDVVLDWQGDEYVLGHVERKKTVILIPKECHKKDLTRDPASGDRVSLKESPRLMVTALQPAAFYLNESTTIFFRMVPMSKRLQVASRHGDPRMANPLTVSSVMHGTAAVTALILAQRGLHHFVPPPEPERLAKIILPPPPPVPVVQATPMPTPALPSPLPTPQIAQVPTPEPTPLPTATPHEVAKVEKPIEKPVEKRKEIKLKEVKKVVENTKRRKLALARQEDPGEKHVKPAQRGPASIEPPPEKVVAKPVEKVAQVTTPPPAKEATPQPFDPKSVGMMKMLSNLAPAPSNIDPKIEKLQISRAPESVPRAVMGNQEVKGTGELLSNLNRSAQTAKSTQDGATGVAIGGNSGKGTYGVAGLSGNSGKRKITGSVVGDATYTETTKNEGLTKDEIDKVVKQHLPRIQQCYERSLIDAPDLAGNADFEWEITPDGSVTSASVKSTTLKNGDHLLSCVKAIFMKMTFPAAKNGESTTPTVNFPFGRY